MSVCDCVCVCVPTCVRVCLHVHAIVHYACVCSVMHMYAKIRRSVGFTHSVACVYRICGVRCSAAFYKSLFQWKLFLILISLNEA
jgi:hypothetical protein